jgi:sec-independent protein translocase protein TatA
MFRNPLTDVLVVVLVLILFFGPKRLPLLGRSIGEGIKEFKEGITGGSSSEEDKPQLTAQSDTSAQTAAPVGPAAPAVPAETVESGSERG